MTDFRYGIGFIVDLIFCALFVLSTIYLLLGKLKSG